MPAPFTDSLLPPKAANQSPFEKESSPFPFVCPLFTQFLSAVITDWMAQLCITVLETCLFGLQHGTYRTAS